MTAAVPIPTATEEDLLTRVKEWIGQALVLKYACTERGAEILKRQRWGNFANAAVPPGIIMATAFDNAYIRTTGVAIASLASTATWTWSLYAANANWEEQRKMCIIAPPTASQLADELRHNNAQLADLPADADRTPIITRLRELTDKIRKLQSDVQAVVDVSDPINLYAQQQAMSNEPNLTCGECGQAWIRGSKLFRTPMQAKAWLKTPQATDKGFCPTCAQPRSPSK